MEIIYCVEAHLILFWGFTTQT